MRVKTDTRRQAILQAALSVFREVGFERASMSEIAARVGGSKATLYGYFSSKDQLYAAAMLAAIETESEQVVSLLDPRREDTEQVLRAFGESYLGLVTSPEVIADKRTIISQASGSDLGARLYDQGERRAWAELERYLEGRMHTGALRRDDPQIAALHLQGLLEAGILDPLLYGAAPRLTVEDAATLAARAFMRIYGVD
jgi:AcrR family transcriptional regulator